MGPTGGNVAPSIHLAALPATESVVWNNQVNTSVAGTTITKTGGQPYLDDAGAASQQSITGGDGAFQFTIDEVSRFRFVGFGHSPTWQGAAGIDFAFRLQAGHADVYENAAYVTDILVAVGDVMEIDVVGGVARYYKNGVLQYTSVKAPVYPLYVSTSMIDANSTIAQAQISGSPPSGGAYPCGASPCGRGLWPPATWRPYASTSAFNRTVNPTALLMANSAAIINRMLGDISANKQVANMLTPVDGHGGWPTYWGTNADPVYTMTCAWGACSVSTMQAHAPAGAVMQGGNAAPAGSDRHLTLIDQTTPDPTEFDLWHVSTSPLPASGGNIATDWSGYTMLGGDGLAIGVGEGNAGRYGNIAGRVRIEELQDAIARRTYINHALTIVVDCTSGTTVYPARDNSGRACSQIGKSNINAPPMGARIHLAMTPGEIDAMAIPEWKKVFLRTLSVYGGIINDTGASFYFDWQMESGDQYSSVNGTDPWLDFGRNMAATPGSDWIFDASWPGGGTYTGLWQRFNDGIDWTAVVWNRLEVLDPCVSTGTC